MRCALTRCRATSTGAGRSTGAHQHEAADMLAARNTPIHAVDDGTVVRLFLSKGGRSDDLPVRSHQSLLLLLRASRALRVEALRKGRR